MQVYNVHRPISSPNWISECKGFNNHIGMIDGFVCKIDDYSQLHHRGKEITCLNGHQLKVIYNDRNGNKVYKHVERESSESSMGFLTGVKAMSEDKEQIEVAYMSQWHKDLQDCFNSDEIEHDFPNIHRRADIYLKKGKVVVEFQYSKISRHDVHWRTISYIKVGIRILWVIDSGNEAYTQFIPIKKRSICVIVFPPLDWRYMSFIGHTAVFISIGDVFYLFNPSSPIREGVFAVISSFTRDIFIEKLKLFRCQKNMKGINISYIPRVLDSFYIIQSMKYIPYSKKIQIRGLLFTGKFAPLQKTMTEDVSRITMIVSFYRIIRQWGNSRKLYVLFNKLFDSFSTSNITVVANIGECRKDSTGICVVSGRNKNEYIKFKKLIERSLNMGIESIEDALFYFLLHCGNLSNIPNEKLFKILKSGKRLNKINPFLLYPTYAQFLSKYSIVDIKVKHSLSLRWGEYCEITKEYELIGYSESTVFIFYFIPLDHSGFPVTMDIIFDIFFIGSIMEHNKRCLNRSIDFNGKVLKLVIFFSSGKHIVLRTNGANYGKAKKLFEMNRYLSNWCKLAPIIYKEELVDFR